MNVDTGSTNSLGIGVSRAQLYLILFFAKEYTDNVLTFEMI